MVYNITKSKSERITNHKNKFFAGSWFIFLSNNNKNNVLKTNNEKVIVQNIPEL